MVGSRVVKVKGVVFISLMLLLILSVARAPAATPTPTPPEGETFTFPWPPEWVARGKHQKMVLRGITGFNPGQWDVHACGTLPDCLMPASPQFNGLVYHNPVNPDEIVCDLCDSWTVSADGKTYTFRLRQAQWHDGRPVTAEDIKFSLDRITEPGAIRVRTGVLRTFYQHQSAQVIDDQTIRVPVKFASPLFLENLASEYMKMYPKHIAQSLSPEEAQQPGKLIGSGPWKLKEFKPHISIEYVRNPNYFKQGLPFFEGMHFTIIRDYNRRLAAMQVGQAQTTEGPTIGGYGTEDPMRIQRETRGKVRAIYIPEAVQTYLVLHMNKPPFDDPRVRRAVFLAIDRQELVNIVRCAEPYGCFGSVGTFLPNKGGYVVESAEDLAQAKGWRRPKEQDIAEAKALMAAAGYANGVKAMLNLANAPGAVKHGEVVAEQLRKTLGIELTIEPVDRATTVDRIIRGTHHASLDSSGVIILDPADYLNQHFLVMGGQKNPDSWRHPRLNEIIEAQARESEPAKRLGLFKEAVEILRQGESHVVPLTWGYSGGMMDYRLQNFHIPGSEQIVKHFEHIWWDPNAPLPSE
ncbi:MAG TPA: ABC transporter substrate-binding protein [Alphaproteobacteria bacterium]|nr:ABC transporter substrate-binding protein [Alphaproteobacteria bacterium]